MTLAEKRAKKKAKRAKKLASYGRSCWLQRDVKRAIRERARTQQAAKQQGLQRWDFWIPAPQDRKGSGDE